MSSIATVQIQGLAPYSQSRQHGEPKLSKELADDYERRTWRSKMHSDEDGHLVMPALGFKNALAEAAKYLGMQIPGKGKSTYTKHFESGILVADDSLLLIEGKPIKVVDVAGRWLNVPSDGVRGSGKRVSRCFPFIPSGWEATVEFIVFDDIITPEVFLDVLVQAGNLIGVGTFRVRNNGTQGRFLVKQCTWEKYQAQSAKPNLIIKDAA